ncbi:MAG: undecaprenyl-diphosphatase UppP [Desulfobulbaceae bacterium]|nr:undecaprenyl-diphosphatase UppP [Desulfobulbaceae bacterium]
MNLLYAILLGVLQGATEFLPVSSSGHLVLAEHFLGFTEGGLVFDVALHLGTLAAIVIYFRKDFLRMAAAWLPGRGGDAETALYRRLFFFICLATVPGALCGLLLEKAAATLFRSPGLVATTMGGVGLLLLWAEWSGRRNRDIRSLTLTDALLIGLSQALAVVPGVSRSGITMTTGLFRGLNREASARFSFLLSAPIIFGAGLHSLPKIMKQGAVAGEGSLYLAGFFAAALSGYAVIAWLLKFIRTRSFAIFAYYRLALAGLVYLSLFLN